jgi:hypothetical protein
MVMAASWIVPRSRRQEWRREWEAELWHRAETGASQEELLHRATGVFRDAAWLLEQHRRVHGVDPFRKPLRAEALFLCLAIVACLLFGAFRPPRLPYADSGRLVMFERNIAFAGSIDPRINPRLMRVWKEGSSFAELAPYRLLRDRDLGIHVAPEFFHVLGVKPRLGRVFTRDDAENAVVLPDETWRTQMHADPNAVGKTIHIGSTDFQVVGVMPPEYFFRTRRIRFIAQFSGRILAGGVVARLRPGVTVADAEKEVRSQAKKVETRWISEAFGLSPLLIDTRWSNLIFSLEISGIGALLAMAFLMIKRVGRWRYWLILGARVFLTILALSLLRLSLPGATTNVLAQLSYSIFALWVFLLVCCAAVCLLTIDHRGRCPVCLRRLRRPVSIGSWASQILDQPATEYLCPAGHGTMYIAETGNAPDHWTKLDETWQEFFVHSE